MEKKSIEEQEAQFNVYLEKPPYPVEDMIALIAGAPAAKGDEWTARALAAFGEAGDFASAFQLVKARRKELSARMQGEGLRKALRAAARDRLLLAFIDSVGFDVRPTQEALGRLERLMGFRPGALVLSAAWGLGEIKRLDYFYRKITVDFRTRKGHQLTFEAACETLTPAPENHILVTAKADPDRMKVMLAEQPGEFVKLMLASFGDMPITRLEELAATHGFVKAANWKAFWERARNELRRDKLVEIPTRRAEPLHLKAHEEDYSDTWFTAFAQMTEPKSILSAVRALEGESKMKALLADPEKAAKIADRLRFALLGARKVDDALYARVAICLDALGLDVAVVAKARAYLWGCEPGCEDARYLAAVKTLPARETAALVAFLVKDDPENRKGALFAVLPKMCFPFLSATLDHFKADGACEEAVAALLRLPQAPATLVTYILGRYDDFKGWAKLPALIVILTHAIALGEGKQGGETLRMQNMVRRLFADQKWLEGIFAALPSVDQVLFFERFQASIAWDPATHHMIVMRMTRIVPALAAHLVKKVEVKEAARITSLRSYAARKAAYQKLVTVDIPKNAHDIDVARGYGDLRENFEYQSAKDEQRALLQKQTLMQEELNQVKPVDFTGVTADVVRPGTTVTIRTAAGEERAYTVLGEWDNDLSRNIISNRTKLAQNLMGKKPGDAFELPDAEGRVSQALIIQVAELSVELREWVKAPVGEGDNV